jgi:hypothetical protein
MNAKIYQNTGYLSRTIRFSSDAGMIAEKKILKFEDLNEDPSAC